MNTPANNTAGFPPAVFRPQIPWSSMAMAMGAIGFVVIVFLLFGGEDWWIGLVLLGVGLFSMVLIAGLNSLSKLELSAQGITYFTPGMRITTPWSNIKGRGKRVMGAQSVDVLILNEPGTQISTLISIFRALRPILNALSLIMGHGGVRDTSTQLVDVIPVGLFGKDWETGDIGQWIRMYAPKILD